MARTALLNPASAVRQIASPHPDLRWRVIPRAKVPAMTMGTAGHIAWHEAGHAVVLEHFGIRPLVAECTDDGGQVTFDRQGVQFEETTSDDDFAAVIAAAAISHAGLAAELLACGTVVDYVLMTRHDVDFSEADVILRQLSGSGSGLHYLAQREALHLLSHRWERVQEIADHLLEHGTWTR